MEKIGRYFDKSAENNVKQVELEFNKKFGMWIRPGHSDEGTLKECQKDYPKVDLKGKVVLDLGGHIGGFVRIALDQEVKRVISFEPDLFNFHLMKVNIQDDRAILHKGAVISGNDRHVYLYSNGSKRSSASASTNKLRGAVSEQKVRAAQFSKVLKYYKPELIKMDIEGGEYDLLLDFELPEFVKEVVIEMHAMRKSQKPMMEQLLNQFHDGNWEIINEEEQKVFGGVALVVAHYVRKYVACDLVQVKKKF